MDRRATERRRREKDMKERLAALEAKLAVAEADK